MADNVAIDPGTTTDIATDDIGSVHFQRVKVALGPNGTNSGDLAGRSLGVEGVAVYTASRTNMVRCTAVPTLVAAAYAAGDHLGTSIPTMSATSQGAEPAGIIHTVTVVDKAAQGVAIDLVVFDDTATPSVTDNAPFDPSDTDTLFILGVIHILTTDWTTFVDNAVATKVVDMGFAPPGTGTTLKVAFVAQGAYTAASSSDLRADFTITRL
jgi:hypothetical protein